MNTALIGELVRLRYKLMWAKTRSRNGRIALFLAGYLLLVMLIALLATGGFGAAMIAMRSGKAEKIARVTLTALFLEAVLATNILGFGMNAMFSETELRRYPLTRRDRRVARHLIGIVDPFWFLFLALELGLAVGLYVLGAGSFWFGFIAVLLLFVCNYLLARVVGLFIDRLMQRKGGAAILLGLIMSLSIVPSLLAPVLKKNPAIVSARRARLHTPRPSARPPPWCIPASRPCTGLATIVGWICGLAALLVWLEKRPPQRQAAESVKIDWESPFDRVGAFFGPRMGPLVGHWLRFYVRNSRTRILCLISLPLLAFLTFQIGQRMGPRRSVRRGAGHHSDGHFPGHLAHRGESVRLRRRRLPALFPAADRPAATLRAASYAAVTIGASMLPVALLAWIVFAPYPFDARMLVMLVCAGTHRPVPAQRAGHLGDAVQPAQGKLQQQLRQRSFAGRQHRADRRHDDGAVPAAPALQVLAGGGLAGILVDGPAAARCWPSHFTWQL